LRSFVTDPPDFTTVEEVIQDIKRVLSASNVIELESGFSKLDLRTQQYFSLKPSRFKKFVMGDNLPGMKVFPKQSLCLETVPLGVSADDIVAFLDNRYSEISFQVGVVTDCCDLRLNSIHYCMEVKQTSSKNIYISIKKKV